MHQVHLANVKCPNFPSEIVPGELAEYMSPWVYDGRDFLRKRFLGKKVTVRVEFSKEARSEGPRVVKEKVYVTVTYGQISIGAMAIAEGLATVHRTVRDTDPRSSEYDALLRAERGARQDRRGVHGKGKPRILARVLPANHKLTLKYLPTLTNSGQMTAVVEAVLPGWELKLFSPEYQLVISFVISGINVGDFSHEAKVFLQKTILQEDVRVKISDLDEAGRFSGDLYPLRCASTP